LQKQQGQQQERVRRLDFYPRRSITDFSNQGGGEVAAEEGDDSLSDEEMKKFWNFDDVSGDDEEGEEDFDVVLTSAEDSELQMKAERLERDTMHHIRNLIRSEEFENLVKWRIGESCEGNATYPAKYAATFVKTHGRELPLVALNHLMSFGKPSMKRAAMELIIDDFMSFLSRSRSGAKKEEEATFYSLDHSTELHLDENVAELSNLTRPPEWYSMARSIAPREVILHVGPTNSGKTYKAIQALATAESGIYAGPLRLLAWEVYEKLNAMGVPCSLSTGQEEIIVEDARHIASTTERAEIGLEGRFDVAVIDEMQMVTDEMRGWAWTQALLGLPADIIHLCGDPSIVDIVEDLCASTGDNVTVNYYHRKTDLSLSPPLKNFTKLRRGDAVIAFSRKRIIKLKRLIEEKTDWKCAVVYGALPPETRKKQALLFNDPSSGYDILIASDAIGMGLNLNIGRVIFSAVEKFDGEAFRSLTTSEVKQIGGRAGRYGTEFSEGYVTAMDKNDVKHLKALWKNDITPIKKACVQPPNFLITTVSNLRPDKSLSKILQFFKDHVVLSESYFLTEMDSRIHIAESLEEVPDLSWSDQLYFQAAPIFTRDPEVMEAARHFARGCPKNLVELPREMISCAKKGPPRNDEDLLKLERLYKLLEIYVWLSQKIGEEVFVDVELARDMMENISELISQGLALLSKSTKARMKAGEKRRKRQQQKQQQIHQNGDGKAKGNKYTNKQRGSKNRFRK